MRVLVACVAVLSIELISALPAHACRCTMPGGACDAYGRSQVVFAGRVISTSGTFTIGGMPRGRIEFAVVEAFRGVTTSTIAIANSPGNCAKDFVVGETYFVYAHTPNGSAPPQTSKCTRTTSLAKAQEDLAYARAMAGHAPGTPATLKGSVRRLDGGAGRRPLGGIPVGGITVVATGRAGSFRAVSGKGGEFVIPNVPPGTYSVRASYRNGRAASDLVEVDAWDPNGCGAVMLWVQRSS